MVVNQKSRVSSSRRPDPGPSTRAALVSAARVLFGRQGYGDTSLDEVVAKARVTKGAVYHHFSGKDELFAAVYEQVQHEVSDLVVSEFMRQDAWEALRLGCELWIDAHLDPAVQRIALRDARSVLGWEAVHEVEARYGVVPLRGVLRRAIRQGYIEGTALRPMAVMLMGALNESCFYVASSDDPTAARAEVSALVDRLLSGLAGSGSGPAPVTVD